MGKYMRKSKVMGELTVMEMSHAQSSLGVRTRAKTLALQKSSSSKAAAAAGVISGGDDGSYLQLRSRRLEKLIPQILKETKRRKHPPKQKKTNSDKGKVGPQSDGNIEEGKKGEIGLMGNEGIDGVERKEEEKLGTEENNEMGEKSDADGASFGENLLEFEDKERATRESTPCSLIRNPDTITTPGSSNRPSAYNEATRSRNPMLRHIPTANEMNEFFTDEEKQQQREFIEKYNFDPVNEKPLPGRYEWVKLKP